MFRDVENYTIERISTQPIASFPNFQFKFGTGRVSIEDHGFVEPSSWTDEYKQILKLFEERLK